MRRGKYNARKTEVDGVTFDSAAEAARYVELKMLQAAGDILDLELQPSYTLVPPFTTERGEKVRAIVYRADFRYLDARTNRRIVEDVKGMKTEVYKIKRKLLLWRFPGIDFREL